MKFLYSILILAAVGCASKEAPKSVQRSSVIINNGTGNHIQVTQTDDSTAHALFIDSLIKEPDKGLDSAKKMLDFTIKGMGEANQYSRYADMWSVCSDEYVSNELKIKAKQHRKKASRYFDSAYIYSGKESQPSKELADRYRQPATFNGSY